MFLHVISTLYYVNSIKSVNYWNDEKITKLQQYYNVSSHGSILFFILWSSSLRLLNHTFNLKLIIHNQSKKVFAHVKSSRKIERINVHFTLHLQYIHAFRTESKKLLFNLTKFHNFLYNKTRNSYICCVKPAKRLDRLRIASRTHWAAFFSTGNAGPFS